MNGMNTLRTQGPDNADATRTIRIRLPLHVQERMRKRYGEPGSDAASVNPDVSAGGCIRTLSAWFSRQIGR